MASVGPNSYSAPLKHILPEGFKLRKESSDLMCSILYEIHNNFIKACSKKNGNSITAKKIQTSIGNLIPKELRRYAFAAGNNQVLNYELGVISYKEPSLQTREALQPKMLRKGLEELAWIANRNMTISTDCTTITGIMHRLAHYLADEAVAAIGDESQLSIEKLRETLNPVIGDDLFHHAQGHAESNLDWYLSDSLDFRLKMTSLEAVEAKSSVFAPFLRKLGKSQFSATLVKDTCDRLTVVLQRVLDIITRDAIGLVDLNAAEGPTLTENHIYSALRNFLPKGLCLTAWAHGQANVMNYTCGFLKYERTRQREGVEEFVTVEEVEEEEYTPDLRLGIKRIAKIYPVSFGRGCLPPINDVLVDVCKGLVAICCDRVAIPGLLQESDVFHAVNELFPGQLQQHAIARLIDRQREFCLTFGQVLDDGNQVQRQQSLVSVHSVATSAVSDLLDPADSENIFRQQVQEKYSERSSEDTVVELGPSEKRPVQSEASDQTCSIFPANDSSQSRKASDVFASESEKSSVQSGESQGGKCSLPGKASPETGRQNEESAEKITEISEEKTHESSTVSLDSGIQAAKASEKSVERDRLSEENTTLSDKFSLGTRSQVGMPEEGSDLTDSSIAGCMKSFEKTVDNSKEFEKKASSSSDKSMGADIQIKKSEESEKQTVSQSEKSAEKDTIPSTPCSQERDIHTREASEQSIDQSMWFAGRNILPDKFSLGANVQTGKPEESCISPGEFNLEAGVQIEKPEGNSFLPRVSIGASTQTGSTSSTTESDRSKDDNTQNKKSPEEEETDSPIDSIKDKVDDFF